MADEPPRYWGLPAWAYPGDRSRDACRACGKPLRLADDVEGLPVFACPDRCIPSADHFALMEAATGEYARVAMLSRPSGCPDHAR